MSDPTLTPRPASSDSLIGRLVPFIDGELDEAERAAVEAELQRDPELRAMVEEQVEVRALLRATPRSSAPQGLAARVRLDLDAVDREEAMTRPKVVRGWPRVAAFARGALVMMPAAAAAALLFAVTRFGAPEPAATEAAAPVIAAAADAAAEAEAPTFRPAPLADAAPVIFGMPPRGDAPGVSLAGLATADLAAEDPSFPEIAEYTIDARGTRVVVLRRPAAGPLPGPTIRYLGHDYHAARDRHGRVTISFTDGATTHVIVPVSVTEAADPDRLLGLAHALRRGDLPE